MRNSLGVFWRSNTKAWVTSLLFHEWIWEAFCPTVKKYLGDRSLPLKALLIRDSAPAHPWASEEELAGEFPRLSVEFLPPRRILHCSLWTTGAAHCKKLYTKELLLKRF